MNTYIIFNAFTSEYDTINGDFYMDAIQKAGLLELEVEGYINCLGRAHEDGGCKPLPWNRMVFI